MKNIKFKIIILLLWFPQALSFSQSAIPGGVKSPEFWITTFKDNKEKKSKWGDIANIRLEKIPIEKDTLNINFHCAKFFNGTESILLHNTNLEQKTIIGGFYPAYNELKIVSSVFFEAKFNGSSIFTFSDKFLQADSSFVSGNNKFEYNPNFSVHSKSDLIGSMKIGAYSFSRIPSSSLNVWGNQKETQINFKFNGYLPELLIYDRVLKQNEITRVHSYLAIKYGLTIPGNYYNSFNNVIWDYTQNHPFHNRVIAIGKDTMGALNQCVSSTTYEEFYKDRYSYDNDANYNDANGSNRSLTIGFNSGVFKDLEDKTFLFCGDDNVLLNKKEIEKAYQTSFKNLSISQRTWMMQNQSPRDLSTFVKIGNPLRAELDKGITQPTYYLVEVDDSLIELKDLHPFNNNQKEADNILSETKWKALSKTNFSFAVGEKLRFKVKRANKTITNDRRRCHGASPFDEINENVSNTYLKYKNGFYYYRDENFFNTCIYRIKYGYDGHFLFFYCDGGIGDSLNYQLIKKDLSRTEITSGKLSRKVDETTILELEIPVPIALKGGYYLIIKDETAQIAQLEILIK